MLTYWLVKVAIPEAWLRKFKAVLSEIKIVFVIAFIFVGCSNLGNGSLKELRKQGFKTFHPYIDESYDKQGHPTKRMLMIVDEIERLCSYTLKEMENWYEQLLPRLKHNHTNLFNHRSFNDFLRVLENAI